RMQATDGWFGTLTHRRVDCAEGWEGGSDLPGVGKAQVTNAPSGIATPLLLPHHRRRDVERVPAALSQLAEARAGDSYGITFTKSRARKGRRSWTITRAWRSPRTRATPPGKPSRSRPPATSTGSRSRIRRPSVISRRRAKPTTTPN